MPLYVPPGHSLHFSTCSNPKIKKKQMKFDTFMCQLVLTLQNLNWKIYYTHKRDL